MFATYLPPPSSLSAAVNVPVANRASRVPEEVLTDAVVEEIKTRCCFVGDSLSILDRDELPLETEDFSASVPPSDASGTESQFSEQDSEYAVVTNPQSSVVPELGESYLHKMESMYKRHSTATDLHMRVMPPESQQSGTGRGTLIIPGWIRERAAELLFEGGDVDESSLAETILDALLKVRPYECTFFKPFKPCSSQVPCDLRKTMASSILVTGGTSMLPGFIPRLLVEIIRAVEPPARPESSTHKFTSPLYDKYGPLRPLLPHFAILNHPSPPPSTSARAMANAGKAPAFSPATLAWVGGSLAG